MSALISGCDRIEIPPYAECNLSDTLLHEDAVKYISDYARYLDGDTSITVTNDDVLFFQLPPCEATRMADELGIDASIDAHLAVEDARIVIIFSGYAPGRLSRSYYDFTTPCPNLCPETPIIEKIE